MIKTYLMPSKHKGRATIRSLQTSVSGVIAAGHLCPLTVV